MKRKALTITLSAVMAMGTCAVTASAADGDTYNIGICQLVQHDALDAATQGFKDEVIKELGEEAVTFDEQNAQGDSNTCSTIVNSFVSNNVDLILANATPALQAAAAGTRDCASQCISCLPHDCAASIDKTQRARRYGNERLLLWRRCWRHNDKNGTVQPKIRLGEKMGNPDPQGKRRYVCAG